MQQDKDCDLIRPIMEELMEDTAFPSLSPVPDDMVFDSSLLQPYTFHTGGHSGGVAAVPAEAAPAKEDELDQLLDDVIQVIQVQANPAPSTGAAVVGFDWHPQPVTCQCVGNCRLDSVLYGAAAPSYSLLSHPAMMSGSSHRQYVNVPVVNSSHHIQENLIPVGIWNGEIVYSVPALNQRCQPIPTAAPSAPAVSTAKSQKRKRERRHEDGPYIKKPPNAFMVYRKEQGPNVAAELNIREIAVINRVLGQRWQSMSVEEKAQYFEKANWERCLHDQLYPEWSPKDNYGTKRKRVRRKAPKDPA